MLRARTVSRRWRRLVPVPPSHAAPLRRSEPPEPPSRWCSDRGRYRVVESISRKTMCLGGGSPPTPPDLPAALSAATSSQTSPSSMIMTSSDVANFGSARGWRLRQRRHQFSTSSSDVVVPSKKPDDDEDSSSLAQTTAPLVPIDFDSASTISGMESQTVEVTLEPNQLLRAESGAMLYMSDGIRMETSTGGRGGMSAGFKRMLTGQNFFVSDFSYDGPPGTTGTVGLGTDFPSKILRLNLSEYPGCKLVCQRGALLCSSHNVDVEMEFAKKFTTGFFGGEGFVLQALTGEGEVFLKAGGTLVTRDLEEGETLRISSGCLVAFTDGVDYSVETMPGFKNVLFGGEGLFVTTLTGPGRVWLQGMPPDRMISEIARRIPSRGGGIGLGVPIGVGGAGGGEAEGGAAEGAEGGGETSAVDEVAATDAAVDTDRQATVASSGMYRDDASPAPEEDPDSPSSLFGDAAADDDAGTGPASGGTTVGDEEFYGSDDGRQPEFDDDASSFSTDDFSDGDGAGGGSEFDFDQDQTTFGTGDEGSSSTTSGGDDFGGGGGDEEEGGGGLLGQLWDLFRDFTDDD